MSTPVFHREYYLRQIRPFYSDSLIKVLTGIRGCGKSCIMQAISEELLVDGAAPENLIFLNLDDRENRKIKTDDGLEAKLDELLSSSDKESMRYIFIDEIQNATGFEELLVAFALEPNVSIFITGSNSYLLSSEIATKLTGRYVEFEIYTLSFGEFLGFKKFLGRELKETSVELREYLEHGAFPKSVEFTDTQSKDDYITNVVSQIFDKDIRNRHRIRNQDVFEKVMTFVINNFSSQISVTSLAQYLEHTEKIRVKRETLATYLRLLEDAKILYRCRRFDLKSRKSLRGEVKYYLADLGIFYARNTDRRISFGPALENLVYIHLRRLGADVSVGKIGKLEVDFITHGGRGSTRENSFAYFQVSVSVVDPKVAEREFRSLNQIQDNYPKYLVTLDPMAPSENGIIGRDAISFLTVDRLHP